jgi:hypothetical protein
MSGPIWGGSRIRVTCSAEPSIPVGSEGVNLGGREGLSGAITLLVRLADGRTVRLPLLALENARPNRWVPDALSWKADIPQETPWRRIKTLEQTEAGAYRYQLRGSSGRWFVTRTPVRGGPAERTTFWPNQRTAHEVFIHLTTR